MTDESAWHHQFTRPRNHDQLRRFHVDYQLVQVLHVCTVLQVVVINGSMTMDLCESVFGWNGVCSIRASIGLHVCLRSLRCKLPS